MSNGKRNSYLLYEKKLLSVILARCKNEGQQTTGSERRNQTKSDEITQNQTKSDKIRQNQSKSDKIRRNNQTKSDEIG